MIYELFTGLQSLYPDDRLVKLTQARLHLLEGERETALEEYLRVLLIYTQPRIWGELASLLGDDPELEAAALAKTLKEETDDYAPYLLTIRLHYAKLLIDRGPTTRLSASCASSHRSLESGDGSCHRASTR